MRTTFVYVLSSSPEDYFLEQCELSICSLKYHNPTALVTLVVDDITYVGLKGLRAEILTIADDCKVISFSKEIDKVRRSRLMKVNLRDYIEGSYLYIDCDTLICDDLSEVDNFEFSLGAVLDGHCPLKRHPMREYFRKQNTHLEYPFSDAECYFSGGVIYSSDSQVSKEFYRHWANNYLTSNKEGIFIDEPALSKSNFELSNPITEMPGSWNCQLRFGAEFLDDVKILHFCGKRNMPIHTLATKEFLRKFKEEGLSMPNLNRYIENWKNGIDNPLVVSLGLDRDFILSKEYEIARRAYLYDQLIASIYKPKIKSIPDLYRALRNKTLGRLSPHKLAHLLYREKIGSQLDHDGNDLNIKIHRLAFHRDVSQWIRLADKLAVRTYIEDKGLSETLPCLYGHWTSADSIDFSRLPQKFVLKCSHDNGSSLVITDRYSIPEKFILRYFRDKLKRSFGIETAEPHYRQIRPEVMAEEFLVNDKTYSDALVCFKFFVFDGKAEYCQVIYDGKNYSNQRSEIHRVSDWKFCEGFIQKKEGAGNVPQPKTLRRMVEVCRILAEELPFCRVDLYEVGDKVYFSELTFMPACGRIGNFSQDFLNELGLKICME